MQVSQPNLQIRNGALFLLFAMITMLFAPTGNALAEEQNTIRIGGDYRFMTMPRRSDFRDCQRACKDDVSCKAWTFIKERKKRRKGLNFNLGPDLNIGFGGSNEVIPAQCRLKHTVGPKQYNECCSAGVKRIARRTRPNKAERCADYAEKAIEQQDANLSRRCRYRSGRWHGNYKTHYRWCMDSNSRRSGRETEVRAEKLRECRGGRQVSDSRCDRYASTAMDILRQAREKDCRTPSRDWENDHERIYEWCQNNGRAQRKNVLEDAQSSLASCIRRGGGARNERCETYADGALKQRARADKNNCRTSGSTWSAEYRVHYNACRKSNRRAMRKKTQLRKSFIQRCVRRGSRARILEIGSVDVRQRNDRQWHNVRYSKRFRDPVVIMGPASFNGADPAHARVRRVTSRGFEFRIEEFGKDGKHARETLSYLVIEKGIHRLANNTVIEAGTILTGADIVNRDWSKVRLSSRWRAAPVVLAQIQTFNGRDPVNARLKGVTRRGFELSLSEQESDRGGHARENVAFVAITQGRHQIEGNMDGNANLWSGRVSRANHKWLSVKFPRPFGGQAPAVFASAQSSNGADTFDVRYRRLRQRSVELRLQEEQSKDRETNHTKEVLGVIALPHGSYWSSSSSALDDQVANDPVQPIPAAVSDGDLANCRDYSQRAVSQFRRSKRLSCAFSGRTWHGDERRHRRWCRRNGLGAASDELRDHRQRLSRCKRRDTRNEPVMPDRDSAQKEWVSLGCAKAALKRDRDTIAVGRGKGRFRALKLQVQRAKIKVYEVKVTFGNGRSEVLPFTGGLRKGGETSSLDLSGNRRFISKVSLNYKTIFRFPPREAVVCVLGKN